MESQCSNIETGIDYLISPELSSIFPTDLNQHEPVLNSGTVSLNKLKLSPSCRISSAKISRVNSLSKVTLYPCQARLNSHGSTQKAKPFCLQACEQKLDEEHLGHIWLNEGVRSTTAHMLAKRLDQQSERYQWGEPTKPVQDHLFTCSDHFSGQFCAEHMALSTQPLNLWDDSASFTSTDSSLTHISSGESSSDSEWVDDFCTRWPSPHGLSLVV